MNSLSLRLYNKNTGNLSVFPEMYCCTTVDGFIYNRDFFP